VSAVAITLEYQVGTETGEQVLERMAVAFERAGAELADFGKHIFPELVPVLEAGAKRQFDTEGSGPSAGAWAQLSEAYAAWKAGAHPGEPILVATGALRDALTVDGSTHALRDYSSSQFNFGTTGLEYASFHQTGTASMPARPPFDFGPEFERELLRAAAAGVRAAVKEATLDEYATMTGAD
jgi:phage gpG-like protein